MKIFHLLVTGSLSIFGFLEAIDSFGTSLPWGLAFLFASAYWAATTIHNYKDKDYL